MSDSPDYPLLIRNKAPLVQRGCVSLWCALLAAMTLAAIYGHSPGPDPLGRWILLLFGAVGLLVLWWSLRVEVGVLRIAAPLSMEVTRGPAFQRHSHRISRAVLGIVETEDSDGDPYFKLTIEAPGGPLIIAESHRRPVLEALQRRIDGAATGRG